MFALFLHLDLTNCVLQKKKDDDKNSKETAGFPLQSNLVMKVKNQLSKLPKRPHFLPAMTLKSMNKHVL